MFRLRRKPVRLDVVPSDTWRVYEILPRERNGHVLGLLRRLFRRRRKPATGPAEAPPREREGGLR